MSSTSLIILAMYSTINVLSPSTEQLTPGNSVFLIVLLCAAVSLAMFGMIASSVPKRRAMPKRAPMARAQPRFGGPAVGRR